MIKQDYLIRMIQEIISLIVNALLKKKKYRWNEWTEYDGLTRQILGFPTDELLSMDTQELVDRYKGDPNEMGKIELAGFFFKGINLVPLCITYCENSCILLIFLTPTDYYTFRFCHCQERIRLSSSLIPAKFSFPHFYFLYYYTRTISHSCQLSLLQMDLIV